MRTENPMASWQDWLKDRGIYLSKKREYFFNYTFSSWSIRIRSLWIKPCQEYPWWSGDRWLVDFLCAPVSLNKFAFEWFPRNRKFTFLLPEMIHRNKNNTNVQRLFYSQWFWTCEAWTMFPHPQLALSPGFLFILCLVFGAMVEPGESSQDRKRAQQVLELQAKDAQ